MQSPASGICYFTVIYSQVSLTYSDAVSSGVVKVDSWTINKTTQGLVSHGVSVNHMTNAQSKLYSWQNSLFSVYSGVLYAHIYYAVGLFIDTPINNSGQDFRHQKGQKLPVINIYPEMLGYLSSSYFVYVQIKVFFVLLQ